MSSHPDRTTATKPAPFLSDPHFYGTSIGMTQKPVKPQNQVFSDILAGDVTTSLSTQLDFIWDRRTSTAKCGHQFSVVSRFFRCPAEKLRPPYPCKTYVNLLHAVDSIILAT